MSAFGRFFGFLPMLMFFTAASGRAQPASTRAESSTNSGITGDMAASFDLYFHHLSPFDISALPQQRANPEEVLYPNQLGQNAFTYSTMRLRPELRGGDWLTIVGEADFLHGVLGGEPTVAVEAAREPRNTRSALYRAGFVPRQLYAQLHTPYGIIRLGQQASHWGLGILANSGSQHPRFGYATSGDIVERALFATKPFAFLDDHWLHHLTLALAYDLVFDDGMAVLMDGDIAHQGVLALKLPLTLNSTDVTVGSYVVYRNQRQADNRQLELVGLDGFLDVDLKPADSVTAYLSAEIVGLLGSTTLAADALHPDGHSIRQLGAAGRIGARWRDLFDGFLEIGYASGDANPSDDSLREFSFDPNYSVGLITFREVLAWQTARSAVLASDARLVGQPVPGVDMLPTDGAVAGAVYLNPTLVFTPATNLQIAAAFLLSRATAPVVSRFEQKVQGAPAGFLGGEASREIGSELDLSIAGKLPIEAFDMIIGGQVGYFWPGSAFDYRQPSAGRMDEVWLAMATLSIRFDSTREHSFPSR